MKTCMLLTSSSVLSFKYTQVWSFIKPMAYLLFIILLNDYVSSTGYTA
jgi:hypothetical protein